MICFDLHHPGSSVFTNAATSCFSAKLPAIMFEESFNPMTKNGLATLRLVMEDQYYVPTNLRPSAHASRTGGDPQGAEAAAQPGRLSTCPGHPTVVPTVAGSADRRDCIVQSADRHSLDSRIRRPWSCDALARQEHGASAQGRCVQSLARRSASSLTTSLPR